MTIDIPLNYQPMVGENISVTVSGRVVSVAINPMAKNSIIATIDCDMDKKPEYVGPSTYNKQDPFAPTNGLPGSTY